MIQDIDAAEGIHLAQLKEDRGDYFVEYNPPVARNPFATLSIVFPRQVDLKALPAIMEAEVRRWTARDSVPIMCSAFDAVGDLLDLSSERACNHVVGFSNPSTGTVVTHWGLLSSDAIPQDALDPEWLKKVYWDVPFMAEGEMRENSKAHAKRVRIGWLIVLGWTAVLPGTWAALEWAGPNWLGTVVMLFAVAQAIIRALKISGKWRRSQREIDNDERERRMRHYFYHCERNPEGFARLKAENFDREERAQIQNEAAALKALRTE